MIRRIVTIIVFSACIISMLHAQVFSGRETVLFDFDWRFRKGSIAGAAQSDFNDKKWRAVNLPHDWSIEDLPVVSDENDKVINLSTGRWKFIRGDNPEYKEYSAFEGNWDLVEVPADWSSYPFPEVAPNWGWYRRSVVLGEEDRGKNISVQLGKIGEADELYVNGKLVGSSGQMPPSFVSAKNEDRVYLIPPSAINYNGRNVLALRVYRETGEGGIYRDKPVRIISGPFDSYSEGGPETGYTVGGIGWYRKVFHVGENDISRAFRIKFDGVYKDAEVWINGHKMGIHNNGYTPFEYNVTEYIRPGEDNVLAVKVTNTGRNSRWYSGSGIYRHVWLVKSEKIFHDDRYCKLEFSKVDTVSSILNFTAGIENITKDTTLLRWLVQIEDADGNEVVLQEKMINVFAGGPHEFNMKLNIDHARLWNPEHPYLYTLHSTLFSGLKPMDGHIISFGLRNISYSADKGFMLNGESVVLKGGNLPHDNGALGARAFDAAEFRKIKLLKDAGFNAVRTVHNPPSSALLAACDQLGVMVVEDLFDVWRVSRLPQDYHMYFDDNWKKDLASVVLRDRNHPSVMMWSLGDDVPERFDPGVEDMVKALSDEIKQYDNTRPVTAGISRNSTEWKRADNFFNLLDLAGYNYQSETYVPDHQRVPERVIWNSASYPYQAWNYWESVVKYPYVIGDFVWSAFDYLGDAGLGWYSKQGEPDVLYPWTISYCGDFDITGNKRPQLYYRNTLWSSKPEVHLFIRNPKPVFGERSKIEWGWDDISPVWTWKGYESLFFEAVVYSNCDEVKLFSNGKEIAGKKMTPAMKNTATFLVRYEPGTLVAAGINQQKTVSTSTLKTSGFPAVIVLKPSKDILVADGQDLVYVDVEIHDDKGVLNPNYRIPLSFVVDGPGEIVGIGNGDPQNTESFQGPVKSTYNGKCQVIIRSKREAGSVHLHVADIGKLIPGELTIKSESTRRNFLW
ncbi:sugar-binding domain-containing protein [Saccharicrinis sp. FJH54]|uniref:sugar-binding domain-containing protein n=1 Tax=Saccharicrinis sp. FJH54 TaxID=3344665 RepID=UPI0035D45DB4